MNEKCTTVPADPATTDLVTQPLAVIWAATISAQSA
jgi:hypothetical protein